MAFAIAASASWWAARTGHAVLAVPRHPVPQCVGRREHWLELDARALREWAMAPLAISLGLRPSSPQELSRVPSRAVVRDVILHEGKLPAGHVFAGRGHHSHRLPVGQWACPFVPGMNCSTDDWLNLYAEHVMFNLAEELPQLQDHVLVCDCPLQVVCEADVLAGLVFEQTQPGPAPCPQATGVTRGRRSGGSVRRVMLGLTAASGLRVSSAFVLPFSQEVVCARVRKLFPDEVFQGFQFPMIEDLINFDPFPTYAQWLFDQELAWDGSLVPQLPCQQIRQWQRTADGQQVGAVSHKSALPPLLPFGLDPDAHFEAAVAAAHLPTPFERVPAVDPDLVFASWKTASERTKLVTIRRELVGRLKELSRRWMPVTSHLRKYQAAGVKKVTLKRHLGLVALLVVLMAWGDVSLPRDFVYGMSAVGSAPVYGVFPVQMSQDIPLTRLFEDVESHNQAVRARLQPGKDDVFLLS